jgi:hypothetical protein
MKFLITACIAVSALACTNILVSKGASKDGSTMIAYNADSGGLYGSLGHYPAKDHPAGAMRDIWDWDSSKFLGQIPEAAHTYNVVGNANEHGLIIGETTFGGLPELDGSGTGAIVDYGSLIWEKPSNSWTHYARHMVTRQMANRSQSPMERKCF